MYDYLIVGAGLFGSVFAHAVTQKGARCLIIDKRCHIGGNVFCENFEGINVHKYGAHIFHTNDRYIWNYINSFAEFNHYVNSPIAHYNGELYNLPFNMNTFYKLWGVTSPAEAMEIIDSQRVCVTEPKNLEEQAIALVGTDIYEKLIKGYTEKQWGKKCTDLPAFIIKRIPLRFTFDNNYFNDRYQGIPIGGYNQIFEKLLRGCDIMLDTDYFSDRRWLDSIACKKIVFTGMIDEFYDYRFGPLEYRSLSFETEILDIPNYQGNAVVNYTSSDIPYTRIIEHKHFEFGNQEKTVITKEYPKEFKSGDEPYYPVNDKTNTDKYSQYRELADNEKNVLFGGRLGHYRYYDMWQIIREALNTAASEKICYSGNIT